MNIEMFFQNVRAKCCQYPCLQRFLEAKIGPFSVWCISLGAFLGLLDELTDLLTEIFVMTDWLVILCLLTYGVTLAWIIISGWLLWQQYKHGREDLNLIFWSVYGADFAMEFLCDLATMSDGPAICFCHGFLAAVNIAFVIIHSTAGEEDS